MNLRKIAIIVVIALLCIQLSGCLKVENEPDLTSGQSSSESTFKFQLQNINGGELNEEDKTMPKEVNWYLNMEDAYKNSLKIRDNDNKKDISLILSITDIRNDMTDPERIHWPSIDNIIVIERNHVYEKYEKLNKMDNVAVYTITIENNELQVENHVLELTHTIRPFDSITYYICVQVEKAG